VSDAWRLIDDLATPVDAAGQMAADVALLEDVGRGAMPALRLYRWARPALSLGHFQSAVDVDHAACTRLGVEVVRRPTGGKALLHGADLTYAVVFPRPSGLDGGVDSIHDLIAAALIAGLGHLGVDATLARHDGPGGPVCFVGQQGADLRVGTRKLCGSAQVRRAGAVLQHGSILLDRLDFDETDLFGHLAPAGCIPVTRARLHEVTVTLTELGVDDAPLVVAQALVDGFTQTLEVNFTSRLGTPSTIT